MAKKRNIIIICLVTFLLIAMIGVGIYLGITLSKNEDAPDLILKKDADFIVDSSGNFKGISEEAKEKIKDIDTYGVVFPQKVKKFENYTFNGETIGPFCQDKKLVSVDFAPDSEVTSIGTNTFYYCSGLKEVNLPDSVTSIGDMAFYRCSSLQKINLSASTMSIGVFAFVDCSSLTTISIPNSVTNIQQYAFYRCSNLKTIKIGQESSLESIGEGVFYECYSLKSIFIPNSVVSIENEAFYGCSKSLTSISVGDENARYNDYNSNVIVDDDTNTLILGCVNSEIPSTVTSIDGAFSYCSKLKNIDIPVSVKNIGAKSFYKCSSLTSINIPDDLTSIGQDAFQNCQSLKSIIIPNSVESIGSNAFEGCQDILLIAGNSDRAYSLWTNSNYNLIEYLDRITYPVEIKFNYGSEITSQKKLYKQDTSWCLNEDGKWEQDSTYQLPDSKSGYWKDAENNPVSLSDLNDKLKNGEIENEYVLTFQQFAD